MSRTDFEAAYIERYGHRPRGWSDDFQVYQDAHANGAWFGWQAGAAGIEAKAAPVGEREAFEAIAADDNFGILRVLGEMAEQHDLEDGDYIELAARHAWRYFQAGAAYQRQSGVVMPEDLSELLAEVVDIHRRRGVVLTVHIEQIADILALLKDKGVFDGH